MGGLPPQRGGQHGRLRQTHRIGQHLRRGVARGAQQQAAGEGFAVQHQGVEYGGHEFILQ